MTHDLAVPRELPPIRKRASIVAVLGIHGAGKTSCVAELHRWLRSLGHDVVAHPNESLRPAKLALERLAIDAGYEDEVEMLGVDTAKLCASLLKWNTMIKARDAMERPGALVLMDRYTFCQIAAARQYSVTNEALLRGLFATLPSPDLTLFLDVSPEEALRRIDHRGEDSATLEFLTTLDAAYRSLPEAGTFVHVDAERPMDEVVADLRARIIRRFPALGSVGKPAGGPTPEVVIDAPEEDHRSPRAREHFLTGLPRVI